MKIIQVHNYYQQAGGEDAVVAAERAMLEAQGHVVVPYYKDNEALGSGLWALVKTSLKTIWNHQTYREFRKLLRADKPDVVHCHNTFPLISPSIYWACAKETVPVVQTIHNFRLLCATPFLFRNNQICERCVGKLFPYPAVLFGCYRSSRAGSLVWALMVFIHRLIRTWSQKVTAYIALTEFQKDKMIEGGLPEDKIWVKPNFIQTTEYTENTEDVSRRANGVVNTENNSSEISAGSMCVHSIDEVDVSHRDSGANGAMNLTSGIFVVEQPYCLFVGRLSPEKGCDVLIRAWARYQKNSGTTEYTEGTEKESTITNSDESSTKDHQPTLIIVGDGPERESLEKLSSDLCPPSCVSFLGHKTKNEVLSLMRNAQFLVLSSVWYEGFPMTIVEAYAQSLPVLASNLGSMASVVEHGHTGWLFDAGNTSDLAQALMHGFASPDECSRLGRNCRGTWESRYSQEINYRLLMDVYQNAVGI